MMVDFVILRFKGQDGSLGYKSNMVYDLILQKFGVIEGCLRGYTYSVKRLDGKGWCSYPNRKALLKDWEVPAENYTVIIDEVK